MSSRVQRGMTLLELMVTVAVAGIVAALAAPSFQRTIARGKESAFLRDVASQAMLARQQARGTNQPVRLVVHEGTLEGASRRLMRWERLPCDGAWGTCPTSACESAICGTGGCDACPEVGADVVVPDSFDLSAIDGLCWLAGSGAARSLSSGNYCDPDAAGPAAAGLAIKRDGTTIALLSVEPLSGTSRVIDCQRAGEDSGLCP